MFGTFERTKFRDACHDMRQALFQDGNAHRNYMAAAANPTSPLPPQRREETDWLNAENSGPVPQLANQNSIAYYQV